MSDDQKELKAIKCTACNGDLGRSYRLEGSGEDQEEIPIAKCLSCGKEYDQHTQEYYEFYADTFITDLENTVFKLGLKGVLDGLEYEIIGHIRYQEEEEYELSTWDEWLAVSTDGGYHWFVEEDGEIYDFEEYAPQSINLELSPSQFEFEGKKYSRESTGFDARIVFAQGELSWEPEIGEQMKCYDFKAGKYYYTIEQSEDEVSITKGKRLSHKKVIMAFRKDEYAEKYENTVRKRKVYKIKVLVYLVMALVSMGFAIRGCISGNPIKDKIDRKNVVVITENEYKQDKAGNYYLNQLLYSPVTLDKAGEMYEVRVAVDTVVQPLSLEWQSFKLLLIKEERIAEFLKKKQAAGPAGRPDPAEMKLMKEMLDEVETLDDPLESFEFSGEFWDEVGYDDEGRWHESDTIATKDFLLDDPGRYYLYLELYSKNKRKTDSVYISFEENIRSARYFVILIFVFIVLMIINQVRAKSYNELPFEVATY